MICRHAFYLLLHPSFFLLFILFYFYHRVCISAFLHIFFLSLSLLHGVALLCLLFCLTQKHTYTRLLFSKALRHTHLFPTLVGNTPTTHTACF
ncbi:hypothetical protein TRSC58_07568 [Trypanosoma rangeli SC58]|uniref:Uncharacterized protein n=1 Tax=Trypanosoma rangeli SC58 TaxID=429131 RepID=A0A061ISW8_TRYRA|nr:hypothetical protein TRSC58_07568 [Trypanosoma rangeli SC58]